MKNQSSDLHLRKAMLVAHPSPFLVLVHSTGDGDGKQTRKVNRKVALPWDGGACAEISALTGAKKHSLKFKK